LFAISFGGNFLILEDLIMFNMGKAYFLRGNQATMGSKYAYGRISLGHDSEGFFGTKVCCGL
jgi:hypothetical protein